MMDITQKMNLTSYGPKIQKCLQDSITKIASASITNLASQSSKKTDSQTKSDNKTTQKGTTKMASTDKIDFFIFYFGL